MNQTEGLSKGVTLREFLRRRRKQLGLSQVDVARGVGLSSPDFISLVETGQRRLDLERIPDLARVLGVDQYELCMLGIREVYPVLARILLRGQHASGPDMAVLSEVEEVAEKFWQLSPEIRRMALNMVDVLYQKERGGLRIAPNISEGAEVSAA